MKATDTARSMVLRYGMDKDLGHVAYERERPPMVGTPVAQGWHAREFSDETERLMDHAVRDLVGHAFDRAVEILNAHRSAHKKTAQLLLQQETLEEMISPPCAHGSSLRRARPRRRRMSPLQLCVCRSRLSEVNSHCPHPKSSAIHKLAGRLPHLPNCCYGKRR